MKRKRQIFISHADDDKKFVRLITKLFKKQFATCRPAIEIFCSSDTRSIRGGEQWFAEIMNALSHSQVCISVMTPNSIYRPWVLFETGGAYTLSRADPKRFRVHTVVAQGVSPSTLPGPLKPIKARSLSNREEVIELCREVSKFLKCANCEPANAHVTKLCSESGSGFKHWDNVHQTLLGDRLGTSPFSADNLLTSRSTSSSQPAKVSTRLQSPEM
jgi:hypothetical protein